MTDVEIPAAARGAPELCRFGVVRLAAMIRARDVSAVDVMTAYLDHIDAVNPLVNAIVSLRERSALLGEAAAADARLKAGAAVGALHAIPQAIKDLALTDGLRTTFGSPIFADKVPDADAIYVARMRAAGAIIIGKTNVPEFGYGSNSYNPVFGLTRNAYDHSRIAGGSSCGAGAALAMRMLPVADGSDMCGSLRNPAAYNNIFGFRPSQGRIPSDDVDPFYGQMAIEGPMGRSVEDIAYLMAVQAGYDPRSPLSLESRPGWLDDIRPADASTLRFGWLGDYRGHLPFEDGVLDLVRQAATLFAAGGAQVEEAEIDFDMAGLWDAFVTLRQQSIGGAHEETYRNPETRKLLKPEAIWEIEGSRKRSALDVYKAGVTRGAWYKAVLAAFERYDFLLLPAAQVFPFADHMLWPERVGSKAMDSYHRWMEVVIGPTMAGLPVISVPAGFDARGLPMGMQIIGRPRHDRAVLEAAKLFQDACPWLHRLPASLGGP